ncbi:recombinase family protein [Curtobacterium sp. SL109]|uniref:recombinase family protein n=1 Tax=Curtobacterium sp. SL109 TaxID=2994662 RepID=UPI002272BAE7|nr:recombinase family protein [Curtobacterium sp. SL109]MCY1695325.1 recombinase family protein [Curtobacterium sp. SL109]
MTIRESEAKIIRESAKSVLAGRTLAALTRELNEQGVQTSDRSGEWKYGALRDMLIRPRDAGLLARGLPGKSGQSYAYEEIGPASWEAIIPEHEWRAIVTMLTDPSRRNNQGNEKKWLGSVCTAAACRCLARTAPSARAEASSVRRPTEAQPSASTSAGTCSAARHPRTSRSGRSRPTSMCGMWWPNSSETHE